MPNVPPGATGTWEMVPATSLIQTAVCDSTVPPGASRSKAAAAIQNACIAQAIRRGGVQAALRGPGCARPACPATRRRRKPHEASSRLTFQRPEIVEVDPEFLTYPTTTGYKCTSARSETADPLGNVWRSHEIRSYLGPTEGDEERRF